MAIFNPNVPDTNDPNYLGFSKGVDQIKPNQQWEALFKGVGSVLDAGLKATDFVVKNKIETEVNQGVDTMRNAYTNVLERVAGTPEGDRVSTDPNAPSAPTANLLQPRPDVPEDIADVGNYAANLRASFLAGKISKTHYEGTLARFAKSVRDKYPGWRDYVDHEIGQAISQSKPANQYIEGLISDLNQRVSHSRSETDKMLQIVKENPAMPKAKELAAGVIAGTVDRSAFYQAYIDYKAPYQRLENDNAVLQNKSLNRTDRAAEAETVATTSSSAIASSHLSAVQTTLGANTPQQISKFLADETAGNRTVTPQERTKWAQEIMQSKLAAVAALREAHSKIPGLSTEASNKIITNSTKVFDDIHELINNEKYGSAFAMASMNKQLLDQSKNRLFTHKDFGQFAQDLTVVGGMGPEIAERFIRLTLASDPRLDSTIKSVFLGDAVRTAAGSDGRSFVQMIREAQNRGVNSPGYNAAVISLVDRITDPNEHPTIKANIARSAFKETGLIASLPTDDAKYQFFSKMTNRNMAQEIKKLSALPGNEGLWQSYKDWTEHTGAKELIPNEFANLKAIQNLSGVRMGWDDKNDRLVIDTGSATRSSPLGGSRDPAGQAEIAAAKRTEFRINRVLDAIKPIAEVEGTNVDNYLASTVLSLGQLDPSRVQGLPEDIVRAIGAARLKANPPRQGRTTSEGRKAGK